MKIGDRCFVHGYVDEIRKDTVIIKNKGGYFGTDPGEVITVYDTIHPNWIPCSERLPEEDGQYLITVKYAPVEGYDDTYAEHGEWNNGKWDMFCFGHCGDVVSITAWMPLPEPYGR